LQRSKKKKKATSLRYSVAARKKKATSLRYSVTTRKKKGDFVALQRGSKKNKRRRRWQRGCHCLLRYIAVLQRSAARKKKAAKKKRKEGDFAAL
jgi:hypothetical protein